MWMIIKRAYLRQGRIHRLRIPGSTFGRVVFITRVRLLLEMFWVGSSLTLICSIRGGQKMAVLAYRPPSMILRRSDRRGRPRSSASARIPPVRVGVVFLLRRSHLSDLFLGLADQFKLLDI